MLVEAHCNGVTELAAGMKALPDSRSSFAHTQALWRFLHNEAVTAEKVSAPWLEGARQAMVEGCERYALIAHDWSRLNYNTHRGKADRLQMTHSTDVGYELQSSLAITDRQGAPLAPVAQNLVTGRGWLSSYSAPRLGVATHLDELTQRMGWLEAQALGKALVHIVDREADSVAHLRQWTAAGFRWLIRAKASSRVHVAAGAQRLEVVAQELSYRLAREVEHQAKPCRQWIAEAPVILARAARSKRVNAEGKRVAPQRGEPLAARLVVSRIEDQAGRVVAYWYLLTNLGAAVDAATVALWYYFRWRIESYFKLLKQAGHQIEHWEQETGEAIFKRLLIASQACVLTWRLVREQGEYAEQVRRFLVRLSGRQTKRARPVTAPAVLSGLYMLFALLEVLEHYSIRELKDIARFAWSFPRTSAVGEPIV